jgi:hypothetical protein
MEALRQIAAFEEAVQAQDLATARGERSGDAGAMSARQACARLQKLITQACTRALRDTATNHMLHRIGCTLPVHHAQREMVCPAYCMVSASGHST